MTTISKTIYTFEVLHLTDDRPGDIEEALRQSDTGHMVGNVTVESTEDVDDSAVEAELVKLGNDGEFFKDELEDAALNDALQDVADAAYGDSNDKEIDLLRDALMMTLDRLGIEMPEGRDPDDDLTPIAPDEAPCVSYGRHQITQRHNQEACPTNPERKSA